MADVPKDNIEYSKLPPVEYPTTKRSATGDSGVNDDLKIVPGKRGNLQEIARGMLYLISGLTILPGLGLLSQSVVVDDGSVGIAINDGRPQLLAPGRHCLVSPLNSRHNFRTYPLTSADIQVLNMHIITIGEEEFGLAQEQGQPLILGPGVHVIDSPFFSLLRRVPQNSESISHQNLHRVIVPEGKRGLAMDGDVPMILQPGIYTKVSPLFKYIKSEKVDQQVVDLSPFTLITPYDGEVAVAFKRGVLAVLQPGEHFLLANDNDEFLGFLPTTEMVRDMKVLDILTSDGLLVRIKGSISFRIVDAEIAIKNIGESEGLVSGRAGAHGGRGSDRVRQQHLKHVIFDTILKRANDTLAGLLTGSDILTSGGLGFATASTVVSVDMDKTNKGKQEEMLYNAKEQGKLELSSMISQEFTKRLAVHIRENWGVLLSSMSITDIAVLDEQVKAALADGVRSNIEATTARRNAEAEAETARIIASGQADSNKISADGEAYSILEIAKAQKQAGQLLEDTPVAVQIRLAEAGAHAIQHATGTLVVAPDAGVASLLSMVGASSALTK